MNFFKLYIGDYQRATGALSVTEHGAYLLMLQHYYATETPLPKGRELYRLLRADSAAERKAIDVVVDRFWVEREGGLVNERADEEIARAAEIAGTNRRIAVAREEKKRAQSVNEHSTKRARSVHEPSHERSTNQTPDTRQIPSEAKASGGKPPEPPAVDPVKQALWRDAKALLMAQSVSKADAGEFIGRLVKDHGEDVALPAIRKAIETQPAEAKAWLVATCQTATGKRGKHTGFDRLNYTEGADANGVIRV